MSDVPAHKQDESITAIKSLYRLDNLELEYR